MPTFVGLASRLALFLASVGRRSLALQDLRGISVQPTAITAVIVASSPGACVRRSGGRWEVIGPSPVTSTVLRTESKAWLCIQRNPAAADVVTQLGVLLETQQDGRKREPAVPRRSERGLARFLPSLTHFANEPLDQACQRFGPNFRSTEGHFQPAGQQPNHGRVHLCAEWQPRFSATVGADGVLALSGLSTFMSSTGRDSECAQAALRKTPGHELFFLPGFDLEWLLEDPPMLCVQKANSRSNPDIAALATQGRVRSRSSQDLRGEGETGVHDDARFPEQDFPVATDTGNRAREHIFVLGPETSGTRLWSHLVACGLHLTDESFEGFLFNKYSAVFHLSLPWGFKCRETPSVPTLRDFGGNDEDYEQLPDTPVPVVTAMNGDVYRMDVNASSIIRKHRERGDRARVILVARDPRASLLGKKAEHCDYPDAAAAEQSKAFELLLEAKRANFPEVTIVCYEEMVAKGRPYIEGKLRSMGIAPRDIPDITDGSAKYDLRDDDGSLCSQDMSAYAELCPDSGLTSTYKQACVQGPETQDATS